MRSSPQAPERSECPICGVEVSAGKSFCGACGSQLADTPAQEIRSLNYLLSELSRWESDGLLEDEQGSRLRENYERRREQLRAQLIAGREREQARPPTPAPDAKIPVPAPQATPHPPATYSSSRITKPQTARRGLLETLSDPHTIRLLLYMGAAMLVVGVVIVLKDILYLKLQEPVVQATLLIIGTIAVTVSGWFAILRTRLLLTGRALTLAGSLLVPVNFWFLVRSGLIENSGRAWLVCAFCCVLYALTASFLRERLYVYLASIAALATAWTIIYRLEREAFGLYALALMAISLLFLHLSQLFPVETGAGGLTIDDGQQAAGARPATLRTRTNSELWGPPLIHVALAGVALSLLFYMPLRFGSSSSFADGVLRLRANHYDSGIAMLLFAAGAYAMWFTGRRLFTERGVLFYTLGALCLVWTEFLGADGAGLSGTAQLLLLASTALAVALLARLLKTDARAALALHRASLIVSVVLAMAAYAVIAAAGSTEMTASAIVILLAVTYAILSAPRFCERAAAATLAYASAVFASIAFLLALQSLNLQSETLLYSLCAVWPFALYQVASATVTFGRETQLGAPFIRIADGEFVLLLMFAGIVAFALNQAPEDRFLAVENLRGAILCVLVAAIGYGVMRCWRERSFLGATIVVVALFMVALILLRLDPEWFAMASVLTLFPTFFVAGRYAHARGVGWLARPSGRAADVVLALAFMTAMVQALIHLRVGDPLLLAPCVTLGAVALASFGGSLWAESQTRVSYFRVGLFALIVAFALAALRAGFDPLGEMEIYTTPVALLLLVVSYLFARRQRDEYASDTSLLLWTGSLLLAGPLLLHSLQYRLFLDVPAPWRDLATLCASLALLIFGILGRLRAPVLVGAASLTLELTSLALTSVDWLQVPLKVYLISTGALILIIWGLLEFRREQILLMRRRLNERREYAREQFGEWK